MNLLYHHRTQGHQVEAIHINGIVDGLRQAGHHVDVVAFPGARLDTGVAATAAAPTKRGRLARMVKAMPPALFTLAEIAYNAFTVARLGWRFRARRPDGIYERYALFLFATVWLARTMRIPIVLEVNDSAVVERVRPLRFARLARALEGWCFRNASGLVFISNRFRDLALEHHGAIAPSVVSPNGADPDVFDPARFDRDAARAARGLQDCVVIGYVGAFVYWHGVRDFVEAIIDRLAAHAQLRLLLVGDGVEYEPIRRLVAEKGVADRVLMPGRVAHADIPEAIACMDYAILPNSNEYGSPMKLFEFMAMQVPMVAPDFGPLCEVIRDGETGWLFPRHRYEVAVDHVLRLAGDAAHVREVGVAARDYIKRERRWSNNVAQMLPLFATARG
jgi:glycosyltransferase involved in cell wall biosynthesis